MGKPTIDRPRSESKRSYNPPTMAEYGPVVVQTQTGS